MRAFGPGVGELSVETWVADLEAVVDAAGVERFDAAGGLAGRGDRGRIRCASPERVAGLVLYGGYARGRRVRGEGARAGGGMVVGDPRRDGRTRDPAFRHVFSMLFCRTADPEQMAWYDELLRRSTTTVTPRRPLRARGAVDVVECAAAVKAPTLVMHARGDHVVPVEEGRLLAELIPNARLRVAGVRRTTSCSPTSRRGSSSSASCAAFLGVPVAPPSPRPPASSARARSTCSSWWPRA